MMKKKVLVAIFLIACMSFSFSIFQTQGGSRVYTTESDNFQITIIDAYYADLDNDGYEDDIWIEGKTEILNREGRVRYDLYVDIYTPDNQTHSALFYVLSDLHSHSYFIHAYDTARAEGWYKVSFQGLLYGEGDLTYCDSSYEFDPPTNSGSGDPTFEFI